tara:strand:+ start:200318 stop:204046 length:3729 start_codon:yes stop_codon:yes gene_type:complete
VKHLPRRSALSLGLIGGLAVGQSLLQVGCSGQQTNTKVNQQRVIDATGHIEDPIRALQARAELEQLSPADAATDAQAIALIESLVPGAIDQLTPGTVAFTRAMRSVEEIVEELSGLEPSVVEPANIGINRRAQAGKLYAQARSVGQTGDAQQARELLEQAAKIDPTSASIQRAIGDLLMGSNDRVGAMVAYARALELGDRSGVALVRLASDAADKDEHERVIWLASMALDDKALASQPAATHIANTLRGRAMINAGYIKSGSELLGESLSTFESIARDPRWRREIVQVLNQRTGLWILVGDAWSAIGADGRAQAAYTNAGADLRTQENARVPVPLVARQIASALRQGHPASSALVFLDHLASSHGDLSSQERDWARALAGVRGLGDVLGPAIAQMSGHDELSLTSKRMLLSVELETYTREPTKGVDRLASAGAAAHDATLCLRVLTGLDADTDRHAAAVRLVGENPGIVRPLASAMIRSLGNPVAYMGEHARSTDEDEQTLVSAIGIGLGRADLIGHLDGVSVYQDLLANAGERPDDSVDWLAIHAQAMALTGRWEQAAVLISRLEYKSDAGDATATRQLAKALVSAQQATRGFELIADQADSADAGLDDLLLAAQLAQTIEEYDSAVAFLERASAIDPSNERVWEQLFLLRSPSSPMADQGELELLVRELATTRPRSVLFNLIRANELARNGFLDESKELLLGLNAAHPYDEIGFDLLLSILKTQSDAIAQNTQDTSSADPLREGIDWLADRLVDDPNASETIVRAAQGYYQLGEREQAMGLLADGYARLGSFELAQAIEQLMGADDPDGARAHLDERLAGLGGGLGGIDPVIEYSRSLAQRGELETNERMLAMLDAALPDGVELMSSQRAGLSQVLFALVGSIEDLNNDEQILEMIELIEEHAGPIGFAVARIKLVLLTQQETLDTDALASEIVSAMAHIDDEEQRGMLWALPVQSLVGEEQVREAVVLLTKLATREDRVHTDMAHELFRVLAGAGSNRDMIAVLGALESAGVVDEMIAFTIAEIGLPERASASETMDQKRADLVYAAAVYATAFERTEQSMAFYELSLSYDPDQPWANNDYGYLLAEAGERMDYAVGLLERAAKALPDDASVIDSLGWVRYKLGMFEDVTHDDGSVTLGAISLLTRANDLDIKRENATIALHLGDALWRGGYKDEAIETWLMAEDMTRSQVRLLNAEPVLDRRRLEAMNAELREIRYRLQDADANGEPGVSPLADEAQP